MMPRPVRPQVPSQQSRLLCSEAAFQSSAIKRPLRAVDAEQALTGPSGQIALSLLRINAASVTEKNLASQEQFLESLSKSYGGRTRTCIQPEMNPAFTGWTYLSHHALSIAFQSVIDPSNGEIIHVVTKGKAYSVIVSLSRSLPVIGHGVVVIHHPFVHVLAAHEDRHEVAAVLVLAILLGEGH